DVGSTVPQARPALSPACTRTRVYPSSVGGGSAPCALPGRDEREDVPPHIVNAIGASTKILYCCDLGFALSSSSTYWIELFPNSARGRIITRMNRLGRSAAAWANTGSGPLSYHAPPGPYEVERPWVSMRMPPSIRQRMPGP